MVAKTTICFVLTYFNITLLLATYDGSTYVGCYRDGGEVDYTFRGTHTWSNYMTQRKCNKRCNILGFSYAGTKRRTDCFCFNAKPQNERKTSETECYMKCSGDETQTCGGYNKFTVYHAGLPKKLSRARGVIYLGCYQDGYIGHKLMRDHQTNFYNILTPDYCIANCLVLGYPYAGTAFGVECFCSWKEPSYKNRTSESMCNFSCPGDRSSVCGGYETLSVYTTGSVVPNEKMVSTTPSICTISETVVNGKETCTGQNIFQEDFDTDVIDTKWKHVIMIADGQDCEFAVFNSDPVNSFTKEGNLVIKPTVFNDTFIQTGSIDLKGCTATPGFGQCKHKAASYMVLPPAASARINTRESFSFRYGKIEIRAKLPLGDWLVPELWLEPRNQNYGPGYQSGRIRIAMARGNLDLKCNDKDFGANRLEAGVFLGPENNTPNTKTIQRKVPENWLQGNFHNYTLIWTPDSMSLNVDDERPYELFNSSRNLCEAVGLSDKCFIWSKGSKIAPFDQEFYISLGLSVGNRKDFPDNCTNRGKPKPWSNKDILKPVIKFWRDKVNWEKTWNYDTAALYIDHVRVTAL